MIGHENFSGINQSTQHNYHTAALGKFYNHIKNFN